MRKLLLVFLATFVVGASHADTEYITTETNQGLNLPFSDAVRVDNMVFLSGAIGVTPGSLNLVEGGIEAETHQIFANMKQYLTASGSSLDKVVKCTVMMADIGEWPRFNEIYVTYFPKNKPARSAFGANGLALGARVEVECWATRQ